MFHKVKSVSPLPNYKLSVGFSEGIVKLYAKTGTTSITFLLAA